MSDAFELVSMGGFDEHQAFRGYAGHASSLSAWLRHA
jgi:hypothetical protein